MQKKSILLVLVGLIICSFSLTIWAQDEEDTGEDQETVVTATKTQENESQAPGKTEVVSKEQIEESGATTVNEVLMDNGFVISTNGDQSELSTIQLDGSKSEQTLVLVNGVPMNTGVTGTVDLSYLPVTGIEKIEVTHGPLSSLYGSSAIGGVVNIITDLTGEPLKEVRMSTGSFDTQGLNLRYQQENWGLAIGGNMTNGYRDRSENKSNYLLGQYNFIQNGDEYLKLYWQVLNKNGEDPGSIVYHPKANRSENNYGINLNGANHFFGGQWEYKIFTQYLDSHYDIFDYSSHDRHQTYNYGFDTAGVYNIGKHELLTGLMVRREELESTKCGEHNRNDTGLFLQDSWQLLDNAKLVTGLRQDFYSSETSPLSPKLSFVANLSKEFTVKLGYGKTFRVPTFGDLYWNEPGLVGNPDLKPEKGERYDFIGEWKKGHQSFSVNAFRGRLWNGLDWRAVDPSDDYSDWHVVNISKVQTEGINVQWDNTFFDILTTRIGYNYLNKKGLDPTTNQFSQDLNHFGKRQLNMGLDLKCTQWAYHLNWYYILDRSDNMPNYNVLNFNMNYDITKDFSLKFAVDNLGDQEYQINNGYPMPERSYTLGVSYNF